MTKQVKKTAAKPVKLSAVSKAINAMGIKLQMKDGINLSAAAEDIVVGSEKSESGKNHLLEAARKLNIAGVTPAMLVPQDKPTEKVPNPPAKPEFRQDVFDTLNALLILSLSRLKGVQTYHKVRRFVGASSMHATPANYRWSVGDILALNKAQRDSIPSDQAAFKGLQRLYQQYIGTYRGKVIDHLTREMLTDEERETQRQAKVQQKAAEEAAKKEAAEKATKAGEFDLRTRAGVIGVQNAVIAQMMNWAGAAEKDPIENALRALLVLLQPKI